MILINIIIIIFLLYLKIFKLNLNSSMIRRSVAISFLYSGALSFNTLHIQLIGSGIGMYSSLLEINILTNIFSLFILVISSITLLIWPSLTNLYNNIEEQSEYLSAELPCQRQSRTSFATKIKKEEYKYNNISIKNKSEQYSLIVLFNILGALFLLSSSDLISMYLSIELQSFGLYILATLYKEKLSSTSAGLKYFLLGGLSSCFILLGAGLIYSYSGLTNLELIYTLLSIYFNSSLIDLNGINIGFFLIISGFLFKIAAAPFHNWAPDVYDDSPTLVTIWLTIMPKLSILIFVVKILIGIDLYLNLFNILPNMTSLNVLSSLLLLSSLFSLIIGAIVGLSQLRIKRLLAYSTINHVGFLLLCLSVFSSSTSAYNQSIETFIFYIIQYTITNLNIFLIILALSYNINKKINISFNDLVTLPLYSKKIIQKINEKLQSTEAGYTSPSE